MYMYNYVEMARVTGVPMSYLLARGQSIKVFSQILRKSRTKNLVVPNMKVGAGGRAGGGGPAWVGRAASAAEWVGRQGGSRWQQQQQRHQHVLPTCQNSQPTSPRC